MDVEAIVERYYASWARQDMTMTQALEAVLTEQAAKYEDRIETLNWAIDQHKGNALAMQERIRQLSETHAIELRAYEATVQNQAERIRQLEVERVPEGWIPVSERLPEPGTDVLVYCCRRNGAIEKTTMVAGLFDPYRDPKRPVWMDTVSEASIPDRWEVTHWMPLPAVPQPKKEGE